MKTNRNFSPKNLLLFHLLTAQGNGKSNQQQGYILVVAIGIVLALSGLMALYAKTINQSEQETTTALASSNTGFYAAESALNIRANKLREIFLNYGTPKGTSPNKADACFISGANKGSGDFACEEKRIESPDKSDTLVTTYVTEKNGGEGVVGIVPQGDAYQGLSMLEVGHSIYALSFKDDINNKSDGKQATAIIQMDVKSRLIPMFQFATFYVDDLEIFPGAAMTLSGPVHTNGDLFLGSNVSLDIKGQVTTVKDIYSRRKHFPTQTFPDGRVKISTALPDPNGSFLKNLLRWGSGSTAQTPNPMDPQKIADNWGSQIKVRTDAPVSIPEPSILSKEGKDGKPGEYYEKADIRITFKPRATSNANYLNTVPFEITAIDRSPTTPVEVELTEAQRKSLRQPVMVGADLAAIPAGDYNICTPVPLTNPHLTDPILASWRNALNSTNRNTLDNTFTQVANWWNGLTAAQKNTLANKVQDYLVNRIQSQDQPLSFASFSRQTNPSHSVTYPTTPLINPLNFPSTAPSGFTTTEWNNIRNMTPQQIAGLTGRCFVAAPILEVGRDASGHTTPFRYVNVREGNREMRLLQLNIQSLAIWNRDGKYLNGTTLTSTANLLYVSEEPDNSAPVNSFQRLGLAAKDDTEGGMVIHARVDDSATTRKASLLTSPYGFAFVRGQQLFGLAQTTNHPDPTGLTIASDQAIYVQGDYNNVRKQNTDPLTSSTNRQPASILADSFNALSNACLNNDIAINHEGGTGCSVPSRVDARDTTFNAAVLGGTDISTVNSSDTGYNGGLENYPRFAENWTNRTWTYRGSFVSISKPLYVSGLWGPGYNAPIRNWDYDPDFNDPKKLPPLTPQFVVLKQESFIRSFDQ
ncbi:hypothetical protein [Geminocystis herdmanii]|uniref:hypothetical protein n=1 Tax=Geminocystis herdmanii TaxID=669359 RepID=UPI0003471CD5|nr:hypothetical protein [Geminocystis herdmanii]